VDELLPPQAFQMGLPDARRMDIPERELPAEVTLLCRTIINFARGPNGEKARHAQIAELVGVSPHTLKSWRMPRKRSRHRKSTNARNIQYAALYCLRVLASNPKGVAKAIWES